MRRGEGRQRRGTSEKEKDHDQQSDGKDSASGRAGLGFGGNPVRGRASGANPFLRCEPSLLSVRYLAPPLTLLLEGTATLARLLP